MTTRSTSGDRRRLVLVAGVGRSGTSLFTSMLGMAGLHVPQPEVDADSTNPKGFGEPKWAVDFHRRLLRARRVSVWDSRPAAFELCAQAAEDDAAFHELRGWLDVQFVGRDGVVVKDPRIGWFLPLWERAAADLDVDVSFATLLRHPSEAVSSAMKWYGDWQAPVSRTVSWLNIMLETEHATRGKRRVFVRYDDLLSDWRERLTRAGEALDVPALAQLSDDARGRIEHFVDPNLRRQTVSWDSLDVPESVVSMTERTWSEFLDLADQDDSAAQAALDASRKEYHAFYAQVEAIAQSSLHALRPGAAAGGRAVRVGAGAPRATGGGGADAVIRIAERVLPRKVLSRVPPVWRSRMIRAANRAGRLLRR